LDEDSVNFGVGVEGVDFGEQGGERGGFRKHKGATRNADLPGAGFLSGNIGTGRGILADADEDKSGGDARWERGGNAGRRLPMNLRSKGFSIEDTGRHGVRMQRTGEK